MAELSQKLEQVREIAKYELCGRLGADVHPHESILVANAKYIGHRFKARTLVVQWVIASDSFEIIDSSTKETIESIEFDNAWARASASRRAA